MGVIGIMNPLADQVAQNRRVEPRERCAQDHDLPQRDAIGTGRLCAESQRRGNRGVVRRGMTLVTFRSQFSQESLETQVGRRGKVGKSLSTAMSSGENGSLVLRQSR